MKKAIVDIRFRPLCCPLVSQFSHRLYLVILWKHDSNNWCGVVCIVQREILSICIGRITVVSSKHRSHHTPRKEDAISDSLADAVAATSIQTIIEWYLVSTDDIGSRCAELIGLCTGIRRELQTRGTLHVEGSSKSYRGHPGFPRHQTDRRVKQWIESVSVWKVGIMKQ